MGKIIADDEGENGVELAVESFVFEYEDKDDAEDRDDVFGFELRHSIVLWCGEKLLVLHCACAEVVSCLHVSCFENYCAACR